MKVWEWEHDNWLEEKELGVLRLDKYEEALECIDNTLRLREDMAALKRLMAPDNPVVTRCRAPESTTAFYFLEGASGQGFGSGLWDHEGLRYDSANWSTQWEH